MAAAVNCYVHLQTITEILEQQNHLAATLEAKHNKGAGISQNKIAEVRERLVLNVDLPYLHNHISCFHLFRGTQDGAQTYHDLRYANVVE